MFETKEFKVQAEKKQGCLLDLTVTISKEEAGKIYKKAIKNINKEISIPGFRKGKVPEETVKARFLPQIEREWKELLLNDAILASFRLTSIYPLHKNGIQKPKIEKSSLEEGAVVSFSYEYYPEVPEIDFSSFKIEEPAIVHATEQEIADVLEDFQEGHATWEKIENRPIQEGDHAVLTIDAIDTQEPKSIASHRRFHVSAKRMNEWMRTLLIGKNVGEVVEGTSEPDEKATEEAKAKFVKTKVRIQIESIEKAILPEVNEDFAKKLGATSLEDLKKKISTDLEQESVDKAKDEKYHRLRKAILEKYPFDIPASLIEQEGKERLKRRLAALEKENLTADEKQKKSQEIQSEMPQETEQALRNFFVNRQIAKQGQIAVTQEELNREINLYRKFLPSLDQNMMDRLSNSLFEKKIKEYALSQIS